MSQQYRGTGSPFYKKESSFRDTHGGLNNETIHKYALSSGISKTY